MLLSVNIANFYFFSKTILQMREFNCRFPLFAWFIVIIQREGYLR
jgi:hypothetical protein